MRDPIGNQGSIGSQQAGGVQRRNGLGVVDTGAPDRDAHSASSIPCADHAPHCEPASKVIGGPASAPLSEAFPNRFPPLLLELLVRLELRVGQHVVECVHGSLLHAIEIATQPAGLEEPESAGGSRVVPEVDPVFTEHLEPGLERGLEDRSDLLDLGIGQVEPCAGSLELSLKLLDLLPTRLQ